MHLPFRWPPGCSPQGGSSPPLSSGHGARTEGGAVIATLAAVAFLILLKTPNDLTIPQFWAEDGAIFFQQQFGHIQPQLFETYNGYLHAVPRFVAWFATFFNLKHSPFVYNLAALLVDASAITYFAFKSRFLAPIWLTILIFMVTPSSNVVMGNLTNVQWFLQFALFAAVLYPSHTTGWRKSVLPAVIIFIISLTGPFSIFCAAISAGIAIGVSFVWLTRSASAVANATRRWWASLNKYYIAATFIGGIIQATLIEVSPRGYHYSFSWAAANALLVKGFQLHTFGMTITPNTLSGVIAALALTYTVIYCWRQPHLEYFILLAMFLFGSFQLLAVASNVNIGPLVGATSFAGDRYYFFAKIGFWLAVAYLATELAKHHEVPDLCLLVPLCLIVIALMNPQLLRRKPLPNLHWGQASRALKSGHGQVVIPINPAPWAIRLKLPTQ